ncbi:choice-of-anchor A family protein [Kitasatospora sp. NPDC049285]|uniref:choice-of-anchor A family protein n=1 Tax=Kitasatospora sp. NPDC049285 TaxID=3157096 RepID=UPI00342E3B12
MRHGVRTKSSLVRLAVVGALTAAPLVTPAAIGQADQLAPPLGPCSGTCPSPYPPPHNGNFTGEDGTINIYVGGNYTARGRAAEAEGKIVTVGSLTIDKDGGGSFNMGVVGVGSRVTPPSGTDHVTVGQAVDVRTGNTLLLGGSDLTPKTVWGNLVYGTTLTGATNLAPDGRTRHDPAAIGQFTGLTAIIEGHSACMARQTATGTVTQQGNLYTFTGDGTSARQVFDVPNDIGSANAAADLVFAGIPAGATVIVNMTGTGPVLIRTNTGTGLDGDPVTGLRSRLMWNFPTSADATITGGAQFQGSVMTGNPAGTMTLSGPGNNGRVYLAGNLVQEGSAGTEIHNYPFDGDLPVCTSPSPSPSPSDSWSPSPSPSDSPSPSPSDSTSPGPSPSDSPSPSPSPSPSRSTGPSPSESAPASPSASRSSSTPVGPPLPSTGDSLVAPAAGAAAVLLGLGLGVVALARRGRHS